MKNYYFIWTMYMIGQAFYIMLQANVVVRSRMNAVPDWGGYFKLRWVPIGARIFANTMMFMLVWFNPKVAAVQDYMGTAGSQVAIAGILGLFSDAFFDKVFAFFPWLQKDLPVIPGIEADKTTTVGLKPTDKP